MNDSLIKFFIVITGNFAMPSNCISQTNIYHPFPDSNAIWREWRSGSDGMNYIFEWEEQKFINGDTIIGAHIYHKVYESGIITRFTLPSITYDTSYYYNNSLAGYYRQDTVNKKIYTYLSQDELLYDFNLQIGDTIQIGVNHALPSIIVISGIDSVYDGTNFRKSFKLSSNYSFPLPELIEGLGSTFGLFTDLEPIGIEKNGILHCFFNNDTVRYTDSSLFACNLISKIREEALTEFIDIFPNPFQDKIEIHSKFSISGKIAIINEIGKIIFKENFIGNKTIDTSELSRGVYFVKVETLGWPITKMFVKID